MKKSLHLLLVLIATSGFAQETPPDNWFNLDSEVDSVLGVSVDLTYDLLEKRQGETVVVAVIDSGVDIDHEDLEGKIWINDDEIADNNIDDDGNGYVDDVRGWNFIGGADGQHVEFDSYEITRQYARLMEIFGFQQGVEEDQKEEFEYWKDIEQKYKNRSQRAMREYAFYRDVRDNTVDYMAVLKDHFKLEKLDSDTLETLVIQDQVVNRAKVALLNIAKLLGGYADFDSLVEELNAAVHHFEVQVKYGYNVQYNSREIVGDDWDNATEVGYGNNIVHGPHSDHGTHVAGIIGAKRNNAMGINGVAENVKIMPLRAVPNGDERDKDVAAAIRYAVDNGAQIINMSFGKYFENRREVVDAAIKYAAEKDVLMVCSAGNENKNTEIETTYPCPVDMEGNRSDNWIFVGATSWHADEDLVASFSNYGKTMVEVFAPGRSIRSTYPENNYENNDGTSMAAPVVSGVAAIIRSYFPELSASEVRDVIMGSVKKFDSLQVNKPGSKDVIDFSELSITGGVVNALAAVKMAAEMSDGNLKTK